MDWVTIIQYKNKLGEQIIPPSVYEGLKRLHIAELAIPHKRDHLNKLSALHPLLAPHGAKQSSTSPDLLCLQECPVCFECS